VAAVLAEQDTMRAHGAAMVFYLLWGLLRGLVSTLLLLSGRPLDLEVGGDRVELGGQAVVLLLALVNLTMMNLCLLEW